MVKKELIEEMLFEAVALMNGFLDGAVTQEEFVERGTRFVQQEALEEASRARGKRAK